LEDQQITLKLLNGSGRPDRLRRRDDVKLMWGSDGRTGRRRQSSSAPHQRKRMRSRPAKKAAVPLSFWRRAKKSAVFWGPIMRVRPRRKRIWRG
jgi:hypothetical protein